MSNSFVRILLVRHGESEGNVDLRAYIEKGDSKIGLTERGWRQAVGAGQFLKSYYEDQGVQDWPTVFLSPYQRTRETLSGVMHGLKGAIEGQPVLYEDWRLTEKFFGAASLLDLPSDDMDPKTVATLKALVDMVYQNDQHSTKNLLGESQKETMAHVKSLTDGTMRRDIARGRNEFLFIVHGAIMKAFIMSWMHIRIEDKSRLESPNNGDVIELSGTTRNWRVTKLYDGKTGETMRRNMMEGIEPFSFEDLPPVPDFIKNQL